MTPKHIRVRPLLTHATVTVGPRSLNPAKYFSAEDGKHVVACIYTYMGTTHVNRYINIADKTYGYDERVDSQVAAQILGLSPRTIRDMATRRELPIYKVGARTIRYRISDLLDWAEGKKISVKKVNGEIREA